MKCDWCGGRIWFWQKRHEFCEREKDLQKISGMSETFKDWLDRQG